MPRENRHFEPDTIYHVTLRGVERRPIFVTEEDRQYYTSLLSGELRRTGCSLFAECLMGNHTHALIGVSKQPLGVPLHRVHTSYAMHFNTANERVGHLFQSRFFSRPVYDIRYLQNVIVYIHENPVRAKLVPKVADWKWSSHEDWRTLSGTKIDFGRLQELTGLPVTMLRDLYLERVSGMTRPGPKAVGINELIFDTATMLGINPTEVVGGKRGEVFTKAKSIILRRALDEGCCASDVAKALNCTPAALTMAQKRHEPDSA